MTDLMIVDLMKKRDERGLSALYDRYGGPLLGIIQRTIKDKATAEDILSQTMLKAWNKIESYNKDRSNLFSWLHTIARHTTIDKVRLRSFQNSNKTESLDSNVFSIVGLEDKSEARIDVEKITSRLDPKYKVVLDLMYLEGYSHSEISKKLDLPLGTVKTRLRSAIQILRGDLKDENNYSWG